MLVWTIDTKTFISTNAPTIGTFVRLPEAIRSLLSLLS
jgi:formylmethanofuran dehydrogenase subunit A